MRRPMIRVETTNKEGGTEETAGTRGKKQQDRNEQSESLIVP